MHVPSDGFGGVSPERKAAELLSTFFTFAAARIVLAQLEGDGRGALGSFAGAGHANLTAYMLAHPLRGDPDAWLAGLLAEEEMLAVRIMEVRAAYAKTDFEWPQLQRLAGEGLEAANGRAMRAHAERRFGPGLAREGAEGGDADATAQ